MSQVQVLNDVEKTTLRILQLYDNADIVGELDTRFNVIMINGIVSIDRLMEFLEKEKFNRTNIDYNLEYAYISDNEYLAWYKITETWINDTVMVIFTYWVDIENDSVITQLKEIVIRAKP